MSKELEALERLKTHIVLLETKVGVDQTTNNPYAEDYHIVKSALEILEIIKMWSFIQDNYKVGYGTFTQFLCNIHTIGMKKDFEKVKEWFEK